MVYKEWWGSVVEDSTHARTARQSSPGAPVLRGNAHHGKRLRNSPCQTAYSANTNLADFLIQMSHCCLYYVGNQLKPKPCSSKSCNTVSSRSESMEETWCTELAWGLCLTWWFFSFIYLSLWSRETVEIKYEAFRQFCLDSSFNGLDCGTQGIQSCSISFQQFSDAWLPTACLINPSGCRKLKETRTTPPHSAGKDSHRVGQ